MADSKLMGSPSKQAVSKETTKSASTTRNVCIRSMMGKPASLNVWLVEGAPPLYPEDVVEVSADFYKAHRAMFEGSRACLEITDRPANRPLKFDTVLEAKNHRKFRLQQRKEQAAGMLAREDTRRAEESVW